MPEVLEVESYRRLAEGVVGATIARGFADAVAAGRLAAPRTWADAARGRTVTGTLRRGKLLVLRTDGADLGLRFGMTGVLLLEGTAGLEGLFYGPHGYQERWIRAGLELTDGRRLLVHDPRRLARVVVDPDWEALGPDVLTLTAAQFAAALQCRGAGPAIKARLLDQSRLAGVGNLLADEALFRAGLDPRTPVASLDAAHRQRLYRALRTTLRTLGRRGGSHTGDHQEGRHDAGCCPRDGAALAHGTVGGRSTYWCPLHQVLPE
ncbi:MAG: DNA-formamidopyrimidine glycosylase family protein [Acidimicrobiales bacterium]